MSIVCLRASFFFFFEPHSSAREGSDFDDCDVNHRRIKTMSHSPKAAITGIKPSRT